MKEPMNKYRMFFVVTSVYFSLVTALYAFAIFYQLQSGDGVKWSTVITVLLNLGALCFMLLNHDRAMLLQAARDARNKWYASSLPAKASLEVFLQRRDRKKITEGDIDALNRTTRAMSAALDNYVAVSKRLSST